MNITYLIGNGFDIKLGLKTHYTDFYPGYYNTISENESVAKLKKCIKDNYESWANMEAGLGDVTKDFTDAGSFIEAYIDINLALKAYLQNQTINFDITDDIVSHLYVDIAKPEQYLKLSDITTLRGFRSKWSSERNIEFITYNYTPSLEQLIRFESNRINIGKDIIDCPSFINSISHIHSSLNNSIILGVNDISQIANDNFRENSDVTELLVKPISNDSVGNEVDVRCRNIIDSSQLICLFGLSVGNTDKKWWEQIGRKLLDPNFRLIYFVHFDLSQLPIMQLIRKFEREYKEQFLNQTSLNEEQRKVAANSIFVASDYKIFSLLPSD